MTPKGAALLRELVQAEDAGNPLTDATVDRRVLVGLGDYAEFVTAPPRPNGRPAMWHHVVATPEGRAALQAWPLPP